jgi:hypothetical protein
MQWVQLNQRLDIKPINEVHLINLTSMLNRSITSPNTAVYDILINWWSIWSNQRRICSNWSWEYRRRITESSCLISIMKERDTIIRSKECHIDCLSVPRYCYHIDHQSIHHVSIEYCPNHFLQCTWDYTGLVRSLGHFDSLLYLKETKWYSLPIEEV